MKTYTLMALAMFLQPLVAQAGPAREAIPAAAQAAYDDIEETLGLVPEFMRQVPVEGIAGAWAEMKGLQLNPATALPGKYKELIGLAVAAQIPCKYCVVFHTEAAKLNGAGEAERRIAVAMAAITRHWSTVLNGHLIDEAVFRKEVDDTLAHVKNNKAPPPAIEVTDAASARRDMTAILGRVPGFMAVFPESGLAGAWNEFKGVQLNPDTAVPGKYKELIALAVAAQVPCGYCVYFHTAAARLNGATDSEIQEAIGIAAITRHWSTLLNGMQVNEAGFRREVEQIMRRARRRA